MIPFTNQNQKLKDDLTVKNVLERKFQLHFEQDRDQLRTLAKNQILKIQDENRRTYNLRKREPTKYQVYKKVLSFRFDTTEITI